MRLMTETVVLPIAETAMTPAVQDMMAGNEKFALFVLTSLARYAHGDWGNVSEQVAMLNDEDPASALGSYTRRGFRKIWIESECHGDGRRMITVMFPYER